MRRLTTSGSPWRWAALRLAWPLSDGPPGVVGPADQSGRHAHQFLHSWYGWAAARLVRRPHVWHARELVFQSLARIARRAVAHRRHAAMVIAMSQAIAAQLDPANVVVVYDQPDDDEFSPSRAGHVQEVRRH